MQRAIYTALAALSLTAIATVEAVQPLKWNLHNGMDISGTKEISRIWTNLETCQQACADFATCGAIVKHKDSDLCILHELSAQVETFKSEQTISYIAEVPGSQSESKAAIIARLFGDRQPSSILDPWAYYAKRDLAESVEIASYNATVSQCKILCLRDQSCKGFVVKRHASPYCSLRTASTATYLQESYLHDAYSKDLPRMYNFSAMPVFGESLDVVVLYDVGWNEMNEPETAVWTEWSPCMGTCGAQIRVRGCTGASCKGSAVQVCLNKANCCTYQKVAGLTPAVLLPLYITPSFNFTTCTQIDFDAVAKGCQGVTVILNVDNGPGYDLSEEYISGFRTCVSHIGNHGVRSLGYVYTKTSTYDKETGIFTNTGFRDFDLTIRDVNTWMRMWGSLPGFSGIFVDEVSTAYQAYSHVWGQNHIAWYQTLINNIKQINPKLDVVLNSGTACPIELVTVSKELPLPASTAVIFEGSNSYWSENCHSYRAGPYCALHPDSFVSAIQTRVENGELQGSAMLYGTTKAETFVALEIARRDNLAYFYTNLVNLPLDVWGTVPAYFNDLLQVLNSY